MGKEEIIAGAVGFAAAVAIFLMLTTAVAHFGGYSNPIVMDGRNSVVVTEQVKEFSNLKITKVTYENAQVKVFGTTDLPDGAILKMQLDAPTGLCAQGKSKVGNGEFTMTFGPFKEPYDFDTKPYEISALLTPFNQPDSVSKLVGEKGEHLTGDLIRYSSPVGNILETTRKLNTEYAFPTEYPMVNPNSYAAGTPERAFAEYLNCWKQEDWDGMIEFTQKTWRSDMDDPAELLKASYDFKHLVGAEITKKNVVSDVCVDIEAKVYYCPFSATVPTEKKITARVIRESEPYITSSTGDWGINPISTWREE